MFHSESGGGGTRGGARRAALALLLACGSGDALRIELASSHYPEGVAPERMDRLVEIAARRWGLTREDLRGWTIRFQDDLCPFGDASFAWGLTAPMERRICCSLSDRVVRTGACLEASALVHELGHAAFPQDVAHAGPQWRDRAAYAAAWAELMSVPEPGCEEWTTAYPGRW